MSAPPVKVNISEKLAGFSDYWNPVIVGEVNDCHIKLVKFQGAFCWHSHADEDEMFLVIAGNFVMHFRGGSVPVGEGDFIIVPRGTEHMPEAKEEVQVLLVEPKSTRNTGEVTEARTVEVLRRL